MWREQSASTTLHHACVAALTAQVCKNKYKRDSDATLQHGRIKNAKMFALLLRTAFVDQKTDLPGQLIS
jgi:hypothetical protein